MESEEFYLIAQVKNSINRKGYLGLKILSDFPEKFFDLKAVFIDIFGKKRKFFIEDFNLFGERASIKFANFDTDKDTQFLVGKDVFVNTENLAQTDDDEYFIHDLKCCSVYIGQKFFGIVKDVEQYPGNDVYIIEKENKSQVLIPSVKEFIQKIDIDRKMIFLNPGIDLDDSI